MKPYQLDNASKCSTCEKKIGDENLIKCSACELIFHATCSASDPICRISFLKMFHTSTLKPNFTWSCDACLTLSESDKVATLTQQITALQLTVDKQAETNFKYITDHFTVLTEALTTNLTAHVKEQLGQMRGQLLSSFDNLKTTTVAAIAANQEVNQNNPAADSAIWPDIRSSLVVKPDAQGNSVKTKAVKKFATDSGIPINSVVESDNGDTYINTPDVESRGRVAEFLQQSHADNEISLLKNRLPTIALLGVKSCHVTNDEDEEVTKDQLTEIIFRQNKYIAPYKDEQDSKLNVVFMKPPPQGKHYYNVFIRVTPDIRLAIEKKMGDKIHIGANVFKVVDRFHVRRCNRCQALGHYEDKCDPRSPRVCGFCTKSHESKDCPDKERAHARHTCINCIGSDNKGRGHSAFWSKCPTYIEAQDKLKKTIPYYSKSN